MNRFYVAMFILFAAWLAALLFMPGLRPVQHHARSAPGTVTPGKTRLIRPSTRSPMPVPDAGVMAPVPDAGVTAPVPDAGVTAPVPDAGVTAPVPDAGVMAPVGERLILASATIGPEGGRLEVAGRVSVAFLPGALLTAERIVIREGWPASPGSAGYVVERQGGHEFLAKAAMIEYTLPPGAGNDLFTFLEAAPGILVVHPATIDPSGRVSIETLHFSLAGWFEEWREFIKGAGVTFVVTAVGVVLKYGAASVGGPLTAGIVLISFGAGVAYDKYKSPKPWLASGPVHTEGIDIRWDPNALPKRPSTHIWLDEDWVVCASVDDLTYARGGEPVGTRHPIDRNRYVKLVDLQHWVIPGTILELAGWFDPARKWYAGLVTAMPSSLPVFVYGIKDAGGWNGKELDLNATDVVEAFDLTRSDAARRNDLQHLLATVAHEYYHAIATNNGWHDGPFPGAEECMASTFENLVFSETRDRATFTENIGLDEVRTVLGNGLLESGPGENYPRADRRGYRLWPFGKWVAHKHGLGELLRVAQGALDKKQLEAHFTGFARSLLSADLMIEATAPIQLPGGAVESARTGFNLLDLNTLATPAKGPGFVAGHDRSRPLSFRVIKVDLAPRTADQPRAPLIVRRLSPDPAEDLLVQPLASVMVDGTLSRAATAGDLKEGVGGVVVDAAQADAPFIGIATIGRTDTCAEASPLVTYRLVPPTAVRLESINGPDGSPRPKLTWAPPQPGVGITAIDVFAGYKVVGKQKDGSLVELARLLFDMPGKAVPPDPSIHTIPRDRLWHIFDKELSTDVVQVGLVSLDGALPIGRPDTPLESEPALANTEPPPDIKMARLDLSLPYRWRSTTVSAGGTETREDDWTEPVRLESDEIRWSGRTGTIIKKSGSITHTVSLTLASDLASMELEVKIEGSGLLSRAKFPRLSLVEKLELGKTGVFVCLYGADKDTFPSTSPLLMGKKQSQGQVAGKYAMEWVAATTTDEVIAVGSASPGHVLVEVMNVTEDEAAAYFENGSVGQQEAEAFEARGEEIRSRITAK